jgi:mono/diheme cytochrome c family protein
MNALSAGLFVALLIPIAILCAGACGESPPKFAAPMTLLSITPQGGSRGEDVSAEVLNAGERVYAMRCTTCHADDGSGQGPGSSGLKVKPRDFREAEFRYTSTGEGELPTDADLHATIRNGRIETGMPAFPGLNEGDVTAVAHYLKTFSPRWQEPPPAKLP